MTSPSFTPVHADPETRAVSRECPVVEARRFGPYALLTLDAPEVADRARPGQFVMVGVPGGEFLLRRPLSLHSVAGARIRLLVEPRGAGTARLAAQGAGDCLAVAGPLGSPFPTDGVARALLVGGGIGTAPLQFVADRLHARDARVTSAFGFRDGVQAQMAGAFGIEGLRIATDDGSAGFAGTVVDLVATLPVEAGTAVFACGPSPMLHAVKDWAQSRGLPGFASLEAHLACGSGACHGCVIETRQGYQRVCADGPVFDLQELAL